MSWAVLLAGARTSSPCLCLTDKPLHGLAEGVAELVVSYVDQKESRVEREAACDGYLFHAANIRKSGQPFRISRRGRGPMNKTNYEKEPPITGGGDPLSEPILQAYGGPKPGVDLPARCGEDGGAEGRTEGKPRSGSLDLFPYRDGGSRRPDNKRVKGWPPA